MSIAFQKFDPAIRIVNASGVIVRQTLRLGLMRMDSSTGVVHEVAATNNGLTCGSMRCRYGKEEVGPFPFASYSKGPRFLGMRPSAEFDFTMIDMSPEEHGPPGYGFTALFGYYCDAVQIQTPSFAPLQLNMFADNESGAYRGLPSPWRGMFVSSDWDPEQAGGTQQAPGVVYTLSMYARELIATPGNWSYRTW